MHATMAKAYKREYTGENFTLLWSASNNVENRIGIYMRGSCDLQSIFVAKPWVHDALDGFCCLCYEGGIADSRSDLVLQTLRELPQEWVGTIRQKLQLRSDYFEPRLFEKTFVVYGTDGAEEFPKKIIIMSIGADVARNVYRHRQNGLLVDPGGWWLNQSVGSALADLSTATWFRSNFESIGKIRVEDFVENFTKIIETLRSRTGAHLLVFNSLSVDPGGVTHNFQFVRDSLSRRRREFNLALVELSRKLDFSILDTDRILKGAGIGTQVDFAHFPPERYHPLAREAFHIMQELGIFQT